MHFITYCNFHVSLDLLPRPSVFFLRYSRFQGVANLTLHFSDNFGGDTTKIYYIGLRGEATQVLRSCFPTYLVKNEILEVTLMLDCSVLSIAEQKGCCGNNCV